MNLNMSKTAVNIWFILIFALAVGAHTYFFQIQWPISIQGFSVLEVLESTKNPENFEQDYPGGSRLTTRASILTCLYHPIQKLTGISGLNLMMLMIALEILCVVLGSFLLWRVLVSRKDDKDDHLLFKWGFLWLTIILLLSYVTRPNWANFAFPYFHGQFYGFGDGLRLAAIAFTLMRQWKWVALCLMIGFMIHPIKMVMACIFILVLALYDWRKSLNKISMCWGILTSAFFYLWAYFWLGLGQGAEGLHISVEDFVAYTRIFQSHWYPMDLGYLTFRHDRALSPFMGLMLMSMLALSQNKWPQHRMYQFLLGFFALIIVAFVGLWVSVDQSSIILIQICLLRATTLATLLAPFIILSAVLIMWRDGKWHWVALYAVFLLGGFENIKYMSPVLALMAVFLHVWEQKSIRWWIGLCMFIVAVTVVWLWLSYPDVNNPVFLALKRLPLVLLIWGLMLLTPKVPHWFRLGLSVQNIRLFSAMLVLFIWGSFWGYENRHIKDVYKDKARDFQEVQLWAKNATAKDALFMVDPCQYYGWRDFSARSSIGTPREWYMTGWAYSGDQEVLTQGKAIGKALGLDISAHRSQRGEQLISNTWDVCLDAQNHFYDPERNGIRKLVNEFGVDYFIMLKEKSKAMVGLIKAQPVKENNHYIVFKAEDIIK